ncbi:MAG: ATP-binding protein [Caldilineaceae bacterium]
MLTQPLERLIEELKTAVQQQTLDASILEVLSGGRSVTVGGDVHGATIVTGDHNVVVSHHLGGTNIDEGKLLQTSIDALENGLKSQLNSNQTVPYRGLAPFRLQDAAFYFGRDEEQALILSLMRSKPVLWLHGQSGTGKTSLIQAGLLPQLLEEDTLPIYIRAFDESPTIALKKVILKARWSPELDLAKQSLLTYLARLAAVTHQKRLVLLFDQFEEFFTKVQDETRKQFIVEVADSLNSTELNLCVVFSIRSDYFGETLQIRERISQVESAEYRLAAIGHLAARQAIIRPLEQLHVEYEARLLRQF